MNLTPYVMAAAVALSVASAAPAQEPPCGAAAPSFEPGAKFAGEVRRVVGRDAICVGRERNPATWIEVRLQDAHPRRRVGPGAERALGQAALGQYAVCEVASRPRRQVVDGRVNAVCRVRGISLGAILRKQAPAFYR